MQIYKRFSPGPAGNTNSRTMMNIAGTLPVDDPYYNYKMPPVQAVLRGRGSGSQTVIENVSKIAEALRRDAAEITKYMGFELGAQTVCQSMPVKAVINGAHSAASIQNHLNQYIEDFVLCSICLLPETHYEFASLTTFRMCRACGAKCPIDMNHKLAKFIASSHKKEQKRIKEQNKRDMERRNHDSASENYIEVLGRRWHLPSTVTRIIHEFAAGYSTGARDM